MRFSHYVARIVGFFKRELFPHQLPSLYGVESLGFRCFVFHVQKNADSHLHKVVVSCLH